MYAATAARLREMILEGELAPGEHIDEKALCEQFDISKTPLREALKTLVTEGHVTHRQHMGFRVAPIDQEEIASIFEVLHGLEETAGRFAAERITANELAKLESLHRQMEVFHHDGKRSAYYRINQEVHQLIVDATGNQVLANLYSSLMSKIHRARGIANADVFRWKESLEEHAAIIVALSARDGEQLARLLREHSEHTAKEVLKALSTAIGDS
ncbi:GntR family transcriptional regulator [Crenobacter sp. SG2305]|uniref:GntR family transcriptional regulator n=1 Tax=Crenobacter oryzisoli TaxID=3056844 RepID=UPI0025AB5C5C|nr:GntR family transcriptional regulator [Crenobacter sp. SG2305]MDN0083913.1 GntR family transcriptional regulator [Crenobacter sp. SG2305]